MQRAPSQPAIPLFDRRRHHSSVPTKIVTAAARSGGPGRSHGRRASALPWTGASTVADWRSVRAGLCAVALVTSLTSLTSVAAVARTASSVAQPASQIINDPFAAFVAEASRRFDVPATWIRAVMQAESDGDVRAVSPKGAMGLMQIMPGTWADLRARYHLGADPFDVHDNILAGAAYLRELYERYGAPGFLAAYQAGPGRYDEYLATGRPLPADTRAYVATLAPVVGAAPGNGDLAVADPQAWMRAPLFAVRGESASAAANAAHGSQSDRVSLHRANGDISTFGSSSDGLFVPVTVEGHEQ